MTHDSYFQELREQILDNKNKWDNEHFIVFNHEAGTGKSRTTHRILGEMTKEYDYRVLYVQLFVKNDELTNTVNAINKYAGKDVACGIAGDDIRKKNQRQRAVESPILCVSHRMYQMICQGEHRELVKNRDILIIDEYPNLVEKVTFNCQDIGDLFVSNVGDGCQEIDELARMLRQLVCENRKKCKTNTEMVFLDFQSVEYERYKAVATKLLKSSSSDKEQIERLKKVQQILENGAYFYEGGLHTFDSSNELLLLKSNLILDANGFDFKYQLSNKFILKKQDKFYDYSHSQFFHYVVDTSKTGLSKYINFNQRVLNEISFEGCKGVLFITDKQNKQALEREIEYHFSNYGDNLKEIENNLGCKIRVDYHGNLKGVNYYRTFDMVVVIKSPIFDFLAYGLTNFFYKSKDKIPVGNISVFEDEDIEKIRKTSIAGELYQGMKRINRDNSQSAKYYVFCNNQDVIDIVVEQFPGIQYVRRELVVEKKRVEDVKPEQAENPKVAEVKKLLLEYRQSGLKSIKKQELREAVGIRHKSNFTKLLHSLEKFLSDNFIIAKGQHLIFQ